MFNTATAAMVTKRMLGRKNKAPPPGVCAAVLVVGGGVEVTGGGDVDGAVGATDVGATDVGAIVIVGRIIELGFIGPKHCGLR